MLGGIFTYTLCLLYSGDIKIGKTAENKAEQIVKNCRR